MKRHLTLATIAIALGICAWQGLPRLNAAESTPTRFDQLVPAVDAAEEQDKSSSEADEAEPTVTESTDAESTATESTDAAPPENSQIEPGAVDDDPPAPDSASEALGDQQADGGSADTPPATTEPPVRIADDGVETEVIRERYPNRAVKIEREVTQDAEGNYVNHGSWKTWDAQGLLVAEGQYQHGRRSGVWNRWYRTADVELLKAAPYNSFKGPFISQASFDSDRLDGKWTIFDSHQHKISEWSFVDGERHGTFTWWFPNGQKMRQCQFEGDEMNGALVEWSPNSKVVTETTYERGRKLESRVEKYRTGGKKSQGYYLLAREILRTPDDWWTATPAAFMKQGKDERHGHWISWHPDGQKQNEGDYDHDVQVGQFAWWFSNGQRALHGEYADGEQNGKWVWWYENGQKSIQGEYENGHPIGQWTWWNNDGKVARSSELERGAGNIVQAPAALPKLNPTTPRSAQRPSGAAGKAPANTVR